PHGGPAGQGKAQGRHGRSRAARRLRRAHVLRGRRHVLGPGPPRFRRRSTQGSMTMTQDILVNSEGGVTTITLNRLERKNSITADMYGAMADALAQAEADGATRVVVLQGHETIFSAGNDIGDFLNKPPAGRDSPVFRFLRGIAGFSKPLVAAVCGPAVGVGTTMLFHCDLVYAGDNAAFSMPFVNLGLVPEAASSLL